MDARTSIRNKQPNYKISLPNLTLIPIISLLFSIIKVFGGVNDWNWAETILIYPSLCYIGWSFSLLLFSLTAFAIIKLFNNQK